MTFPTGTPSACGIDPRGIRSAHGGSFVPNGDTSNHSSITSIELDPSEGILVMHEGDESLRVELSSGWTDIEGHPISTSAGVDHRGAVSVDLVVTASPHRLELRTDPDTSSFAATWPIQPLFGMGLHHVLSKVSPPE